MFWIFLLSFVTRFAICKNLSFIWSSPSALWMISQSTDYFIACYTVLTRPNKVETAVHGCNSWLKCTYKRSSRGVTPGTYGGIARDLLAFVFQLITLLLAIPC